MAELDPKAWINMEKLSVALVDGNDLGLQILKQIFVGLGVRGAHSFTSAAAATEYARENELHLIIVSDTLQDSTGYDFVGGLRRGQSDPNAFTPVIIVSGHTSRSLVRTARDCGANFVVAKPMSPQTVLERILWVAKEKRPFVDTGAYVGPDRRFKDDEADETPTRRREDQAIAAARAVDTELQTSEESQKDVA